MVSFTYTHGTTRTPTDYNLAVQTDFYNFKNKAAGGRRYGYYARVIRYANLQGEVAYRGSYQTLLDGSRYQSSKDTAFVATEAEAIALLDKMIAGAMKRYAKLALDPANKIERRA